MTVDIDFLVFGAKPITSFSDTFTDAGNLTNLGNPNSSNTFKQGWIQTSVNWDTAFTQPCSFPSFSFNAALSGGGGFGLKVTANQMAINPTYSIAMGIIPRVLLGSQKYYTFPQKFVQWTFNAVAAGVIPGVGFVNFECNSGTGVAGNNGAMANDGYVMRIDLGTTERHNSGAGPTNLHAAVTQTQGDVFRLSQDSSVAGQVTITLTRNGTVQYSVIDNAANRTNGNAFPVIYCAASSLAGLVELKNFSTGIGL